MTAAVAARVSGTDGAGGRGFRRPLIQAGMPGRVIGAPGVDVPVPADIWRARRWAEGVGLELGPTDKALALTMQELRSQVREWGIPAGDLLLIADELTSNAVKAAAAIVGDWAAIRFRVWVTADAHPLHCMVGVWDSSPILPVWPEGPPELPDFGDLDGLSNDPDEADTDRDVHGNGLRMVAGLSLAYGVYTSEGRPGKTVFSISEAQHG